MLYKFQASDIVCVVVYSHRKNDTGSGHTQHVTSQSLFVCLAALYTYVPHVAELATWNVTLHYIATLFNCAQV